MATCSWPLGNGDYLNFTIYDRNEGWNKVAGLYIFCYLDISGLWSPVYVGQTNDFSYRLPSHNRLSEAVRRGATHIHALVVPQASDRDKWEKMLIQNLHPPMSESFLKTYDLFISHAWGYNEYYYRLERLLKNAPSFNYRNYSVPKHDPLINPGTVVGQRRLTNLLDKQIKPVNSVLIISGMYVVYKFWIQKEIELAQYYNKPIIGLIPWGQERTPFIVQQAAKEMVYWNTNSIVNAIRKHSL